MIFESIYMIRGSTGVGPFGTDWNFKIGYFILTFIFCYLHFKQTGKKEYFSVLIWASITWTLTETFLQLTGTRVFHIPYAFGLAIPIYLSLPIQGVVEGGLVNVGSLYFSDRILEEKSRKKAIIAFSIMMLVLFISAHIRVILEHYSGPNYAGDVPSRRDMLNSISLLWLFLMLTITIAFFLKAASKIKQRGWALFIIMTIFGAVWTLAEWSAGTRWIVIGTPPHFAHAPP